MARNDALLLSGDLIMKIAEAIGADGSTIRRIVLDAQVMQPVKVYIEQFGNKRLLEVDWPSNLKDASIKRSDE